MRVPEPMLTAPTNTAVLPPGMLAEPKWDGSPDGYGVSHFDDVASGLPWRCAPRLLLCVVVSSPASISPFANAAAAGAAVPHQPHDREKGVSSERPG